MISVFVRENQSNKGWQTFLNHQSFSGKVPQTSFSIFQRFAKWDENKKDDKRKNDCKYAKYGRYKYTRLAKVLTFNKTNGIFGNGKVKAG